MTLAEEDLAHNPLVKLHLLAEVESALILLDGPGVVAFLVLAFSLKKVDRKPVLFHHFFANLQRLCCLVNETQWLNCEARTYPQGRRPGDVFRDCGECPEMVVVPSGEFVMGSPPGEKGRDDDEGPQHRVAIGEAFAVGKYEVTFREWDACL